MRQWGALDDAEPGGGHQVRPRVHSHQHARAVRPGPGGTGRRSGVAASRGSPGTSRPSELCWCSTPAAMALGQGLLI